jgi:integrase/recombinase XerC
MLESFVPEVVSPDAGAIAFPSEVRQLMAAFLADKKPATRRAYIGDLEDFAAACGIESIDRAITSLIGLEHRRHAVEVVVGYKQKLIDRGASPATVNRRIGTIRALVAYANEMELCPWVLNGKTNKALRPLPRQVLRDTRGPGIDGFRALLDSAVNQKDERKAARDVAILRLLWDLGLRRAEVVSLNLEHVDLSGARVHVLGKGRYERIPITLAAETREALESWLEVRGTHPGPLFTAFDHRPAVHGRGLTPGAVYTIVQAIGKHAGVTSCRPHGVRHATITHALDSGYSYRDVQKFSRHRSGDMIPIYDDNRKDMAGEVACAVAAAAPTPMRRK